MSWFNWNSKDSNSVRVITTTSTSATNIIIDEGSHWTTQRYNLITPFTFLYKQEGKYSLDGQGYHDAEEIVNEFRKYIKKDKLNG